MTLLLPAAFFAALDRGGVLSAASATLEGTTDAFINDTNREIFLQMSRGLAVILLTVLVPPFFGGRLMLTPPLQIHLLQNFPSQPSRPRQF